MVVTATKVTMMRSWEAWLPVCSGLRCRLRLMKKEEEEVTGGGGDGGKQSIGENSSSSSSSFVTRGLVAARMDSKLISVLPLLLLLSLTGSRHPETGRKGAGGRKGDDNNVADWCGGGDDSAIDRRRRGLGGSNRAAAPGSRRLPIAISQRDLGCVFFLARRDPKRHPSAIEEREPDD